MNLIEVVERFPDQDTCVAHLERIRWRGTPVCPHCESKDVVRKKEEGVGRVGRFNCHDCGLRSKLPVARCFMAQRYHFKSGYMAITMIVNAKKSLSSHELARDLDLKQKTAWYLMTRIRAEMANKTNPIVLQGIIEADETYIGGKPRKENKKADREPAKRGRGTSKTAVIGAVERGGQVVAEVAKGLSGRAILEFIRRVVNIKESELMTDEYHAYNALSNQLKHHVINHQEQYVDGDKHTNTIEGFWSLLKRAWYGQHHHYSIGYTPLYVAERCYVYNNRNRECIWTKFVNESMKV